MPLKPEEVSSIIRQELEKYKTRMRSESIGTVIQVGDTIARIHGLDDVMTGELVQFSENVLGMVLNLEFVWQTVRGFWTRIIAVISW